MQLDETWPRIVLLFCIILGVNSLRGSELVLQKQKQQQDETKANLTAEGEEGGDTNGTKPLKPHLTGIPQIDYVHDPNLPRELNGFNLSDYPFYNAIPPGIEFECDGLHDGFYASVPHHCQVYHHCLFGIRYDFLCANYTAFDQKTFICHFVSEVDCDNSPKYYIRNEALYKAATTAAPIVIPTTRATPPPTEAATRRPQGASSRRRRPFRRRPAYDYYYDDEYDDEEYYDDEPPPPRKRKNRNKGRGYRGRGGDDDDYEESTSEGPAKMTVRPQGAPGSVYDQPRVPPKIRRPVPINERSKYDYSTTLEPPKPGSKGGAGSASEEEDEEYDLSPKRRNKESSYEKSMRRRPESKKRPMRYEEDDEEYDDEIDERPKMKKMNRYEDDYPRGRQRDRNNRKGGYRGESYSRGHMSERGGSRKRYQEMGGGKRKPERRPVYDDEEEEDEEYEYYDDEEEVKGRGGNQRRKEGSRYNDDKRKRDDDKDDKRKRDEDKDDRRKRLENPRREVGRGESDKRKKNYDDSQESDKRKKNYDDSQEGASKGSRYEEDVKRPNKESQSNTRRDNPRKKISEEEDEPRDLYDLENRKKMADARSKTTRSRYESDKAKTSTTTTTTTTTKKYEKVKTTTPAFDDDYEEEYEEYEDELDPTPTPTKTVMRGKPTEAPTTTTKRILEEAKYNRFTPRQESKSTTKSYERSTKGTTTQAPTTTNESYDDTPKRFRPSPDLKLKVNAAISARSKGTTEKNVQTTTKSPNVEPSTTETTRYSPSVPFRQSSYVTKKPLKEIVEQTEEPNYPTFPSRDRNKEYTRLPPSGPASRRPAKVEPQRNPQPVKPSFLSEEEYKKITPERNKELLNSGRRPIPVTETNEPFLPINPSTNGYTTRSQFKPYDPSYKTDNRPPIRAENDNYFKNEYPTTTVNYRSQYKPKEYDSDKYATSSINPPTAVLPEIKYSVNRPSPGGNKRFKPRVEPSTENPQLNNLGYRRPTQQRFVPDSSQQEDPKNRGTYVVFNQRFKQASPVTERQPLPFPKQPPKPFEITAPGPSGPEENKDTTSRPNYPNYGNSPTGYSLDLGDEEYDVTLNDALQPSTLHPTRSNAFPSRVKTRGYQSAVTHPTFRGNYFTSPGQNQYYSNANPDNVPQGSLTETQEYEAIVVPAPRFSLTPQRVAQRNRPREWYW